MPANQVSRWIKKLFGIKTVPAKARSGEHRPRQARRGNLLLEPLETRELLSANPLVQSINLTTPAGPITNASSVSYTVTFSETVTGVDLTEFALAKTGTVAAALTQVTPVSGSVYTVTVSGITGNGTLGLNLVNDGSIHDLAGDKLVGGPASFQNPQTFAIEGGVGSLAVGDVNGDGNLDLVFSNAVLLGNGDGTFQAPLTGKLRFQQQTPMAAARTSRRRQARPCRRHRKPGVSVLLGNGDDTFQAPLTFALGLRSSSVAVADLTGDGKPDIVVGDFANHTVGVLLGNGDGTFQNEQTVAAGVYPFSVAVGDVNGDGKPDLVVASVLGISVLLGNGDGTFQGPVTITSISPSSVAVADVNGDGKLDLVTGTYTSTPVSVLLGNGDGTFQNPQTIADGLTQVYGRFVAVADLNRDGKPDVVVSGGSVSVLLNTANGDFTGQVYTIDHVAPVVLAINPSSPASPITDASSVSFTVIFSKPVTGVDPTDFTLAETGTVATALTQVTPVSNSVYTVTVSGITGNGTLGLNLATNGSSNIRDLAGNTFMQGDTVPVSFLDPQTFTTGQSRTYSVVVADVNGDGKPDIVTTGYDYYVGVNSVRVLLGNGDGTFQSPQYFAAGITAPGGRCRRT